MFNSADPKSSIITAYVFGVIIKIDMAKIDILKQAVALDRDSYRPLVCISEEQGLFYVDFFFNKQGVSLLTQNNVVLQIYKAPRYLNPDDVEDGEKATKENNKFNIDKIFVF